MTGEPRERDPRPLRPDPSECCGSGCNPCILEVYEDELAAWEEREQRRQQAAATGGDNPETLTESMKSAAVSGRMPPSPCATTQE